MNRDFDFNRVGKQMPYTVPEDFFAKLEDDVCRKVTSRRRMSVKDRRSFMRFAVVTLATAAASVILFFVIDGTFKATAPVEFAEVEQAFGCLSTEDQMYMLSVYQDDIFINE